MGQLIVSTFTLNYRSGGVFFSCYKPAQWQSGLMRKTRNLVPSGASVRIRPASSHILYSLPRPIPGGSLFTIRPQNLEAYWDSFPDEIARSRLFFLFFFSFFFFFLGVTLVYQESTYLLGPYCEAITSLLSFHDL
ncbi:hypothetical protein F5X96DRAFT_291743 [Biscogniauxia mediterranea]|nr:hypothetical protein F5X96DRAFT_291743 [Biscogniauxia mediterranea]